uniref:C2H2-type domain-containing protein n=1 Tax=viral metagenome TaxID=1070528 RepID=A0A6C0I0C1_9ZZZZ
MAYICPICNKSFTTNGGLKRHNEKKIPCVIINSTNDKFKCDTCNHNFTTNHNLRRHITNICPIIKNKKTEVQIMKDEIIELKNAMDELKKNINNNTAINSNGNAAINSNNNIAINSNNTINNNQNITINITPFSRTKLTEKCIIDLFLDESTSACEYSKMELMDKADQRKERTKNLIKLLFLESFEKSFSDDITNVNVYLAEDREDTAKIYQENKKWLPKSVMSVLKKEFDIFIKKCNDISGHINYPDNTPIGYQNSINQAISILRSMHDNEIIKDAKPEFNIILEANRDRLKNENII